MEIMKKLYFISFFIFLLFINLFSQTKIDSLETRLKNATSNEKNGILNDLSHLYISHGSYKKSIEYGKQALELSKKAESDGEGKGAKFIVNVPIKRDEYNNEKFGN